MLSPLVGLAQIQQRQFTQQQTYPGIGGTDLVGGSASQSIPTLTKFLFNLAVWICILAAILTLILGGIQYITASGDVGKMTAAKGRIYNSLLGLAILVGAYFVLQKMNPDLVIPKITYVPLQQGVILFTEDGYKEIVKASDDSIINDLIQSNNAFRINYDLPDLTKEFGELVVYPNDDLNFENFELYAIGFWGSRESQSIVAFYPQKNYSTTYATNPTKYISAIGEVDKDGKPLTTPFDPRPSFSNANIKGMQYIEVFNQSAGAKGYEAPVEYFDITKYDPKTDKTKPNQILIYSDQRRAELAKIPSPLKTSTDQKHPPMSLKITRNGPGVYLADASGNERYFDASARNFKEPSISFDQQAKTIKIVNDIPERKYTGSDGKEQIIPAEFHDFLAILHRGDNFSGMLRIYFQARKYNKTIPLTSPNEDYGEKAEEKRIPIYNLLDGRPVTEATWDQYLNDYNSKYKEFLASLLTKDNLIKDGLFYYFDNYYFGNLPTLPKGALGLPRERKLDDTIVLNPDSNGKTGQLGSPDFQDIYGLIDKNRSISSLQIFELADDQKVCEEVMVCTEKQGRGYCLAYEAIGTSKTDENNIIYLPMPVYVPVNLPNGLADSLGGDGWPIFTGPNNAKKTVGFRLNVKSIIIKGRCAVVLFDHGVVGNGALFAPGSHSEVFTSSDYDLEDNEIGLCGSVGLLNRQIGRECASAIAVYPIK